MSNKVKQNIAVAVGAAAFITMVGATAETMTGTIIIKAVAGAVFYLCSKAFPDETKLAPAATGASNGSTE